MATLIPNLTNPILPVFTIDERVAEMLVEFRTTTAKALKISGSPTARSTVTRSLSISR
jgi:hypothetical protein